MSAITDKANTLVQAVHNYGDTVDKLRGAAGGITPLDGNKQVPVTNLGNAPVQSVASKTGAVTLTKADVGLGNVDNTSDVNKPVSTATQTALNAKLNSNQVGAANGVASLDGTGKVPAVQLPSYVDDVLEYASQSAFPSTGETGKIYTALDTNKIYRWSGSVYIEISPSPGSTDAVPEGSTNKYFTTARAAAAAPVQSVAGKTGAVTLVAADVSGLATVATTGSYNDLASKPTIPTNNTQLTNGAGFITAGGAPVQSVAGKTGAVTLSAADVGLGNVNNTADSTKSVANAATWGGSNKTVSSAAPSGGVDGDFWFQY